MSSIDRKGSVAASLGNSEIFMRTGGPRTFRGAPHVIDQIQGSSPSYKFKAKLLEKERQELF